MPTAAHRPAGLLDWLGEALAGAGPLAVQPAPGLSGAVQTWAVEGPSGRWFCRWGLSPRKAQQELRVAQEIWPRLAQAPDLQAADPARGALLMTALPGTPEAHTSDALGALGAAVATLHRLTCPADDPMPLDEALERRVVAAWRGLPAADRARWAAAYALARQTGAFRGAGRRWCHRDLRPGNWIWDGARVGLVDWEHARPDAVELDLARLAHRSGWAAFARGYGPIDPQRLAIARAATGLATLAWGRRHHAAPFVAEGTAVLTALEGG